MARKPVSSTTGCAAHGMKAAASVKATGGAHASAMEATTASAKAATWVEAAATGRMETTAVKPAATAMKTAATAETATASAMKAAATAVETATAAAVKASASTAAAAWLRLGEAGEREARNSPREDCGKRERNLSAGNAHVFLPCRNGGRESRQRHVLL